MTSLGSSAARPQSVAYRNPHPHLRPKPKQRPNAVRRSVLLFLGLLAVCAVLIFCSEPFRLLQKQKSQLIELRERLDRAEKRQKLLLHQIRLLQTPAGLEIEARNLGYIKPGEIPIFR
ncbi:MAG: FtsB family cell division protein [Armatimonadota bacterium]